MGSQTTQTTQQYTPTATETALMNNELAVSNAGQAGTIANQGYAQNLQGLLMQGQALPGYLSTLPGGVSTSQSMNEAALGNQSVATQYQQMGGLDSGSAAQGLAFNAANTINSNAQFDVSNLGQLMNLAAGQAYQMTGNSQANNSALGQQSGALAGSSSSSNIFANPFSQAISAASALNGAGGSTSNPNGVSSSFML